MVMFPQHTKGGKIAADGGLEISGAQRSQFSVASTQVVLASRPKHGVVGFSENAESGMKARYGAIDVVLLISCAQFRIGFANIGLQDCPIDWIILFSEDLFRLDITCQGPSKIVIRVAG